MLKKFLIGLLLFFQISVSIAQEFSSINYTVENGLPSNEVYDVIEDSNGYLWFCTDRGISKYDGIEFKNYNTSNSNISDNTIFNGFSNGQQIWFTAYDGSITIYDVQADSLYPFKHNAYIDSIVKVWFEVIYFYKNKVYLIPQKIGGATIIEYDPLADKLKRLEDEEFFDIETNQELISLFPVRKNIRYLRSSSKVPTALGSIPEASFKGGYFLTPIIHIEDDKQGAIYFGIRDVLYRYKDGICDSLLKCKKRINQIRLDQNNKPIALTDHGFYRMENGKWVNHFIDQKFSGLKIDFENNYWFTTLTHGIIMIPYSNLLSQNKALNIPENEKMIGISRYKNKLIFTTDENQIHSIDPEYNTQKISIDSSETYGQLGPSVKLRFFHSNDSVGYFSGNWILEEKGKELEVKLNGINAGYNHVFPIRDTLLLSVQGHGYLLCHRDSIQDYTTYDIDILRDHSPEMPTRISSLLQSKDRIWIGTFDGLWFLNKFQLDKPRLYSTKLKDVRIHDVKSNSQGIIFSGTSGVGLTIIDKDSLLIFNGSNSDVPDLINCLEIQNDSIIWIGSTDGIKKMSYQNYQLKLLSSFSYSSGFKSQNILDFEIWDKQLWITASNAIYSLNLDNSIPISTPPKVHILDVLIGEGSFLAQEVFNSHQNNLKIKYLGITHHKPKDNFYRYRLVSEESDTNWNYTNNSEVIYTNLPHGEYVFEIAAQNKDRVWSDSEIYSFKILPHFTQTFIYKILLILGLISLAVYVIRRRSLQEKEKNKNAMQIKSLELNSLRNQMNPHFVFNSLNSLQNLIVKDDKSSSLEFVGNFSELMRKSLDFSRQDLISLDDEIKFLEQYLETELIRFPKRFQYQINIDQNFNLYDHLIPPLLIQPLIENSVKHAFPDSIENGRIMIHFSEIENALKVVIEDNGVGIHSSNKNSKIESRDSHGLKIVKERIAIIKSQYSGMRTKLTIEDLGLSEKGERGTKITIQLPIID